MAERTTAKPKEARVRKYRGLVVPVFSNESEEAEWWPKQGEALADAFAKAAREGKLERGSFARKLGLTPTTTIRLNPDDIVTARKQAERKGLRYQTYLKMLLHEALQKEEKKAS